MNDVQPEQLSPTGLARREAMLDELIGVVKRTRRARRVRRRMLAVSGCMGLLLMMGWVARSGSPIPGEAPRIAETASDSPSTIQHTTDPQRRHVVTLIVQTDPAVVERFRARPRDSIVRIDDRMLLDALASIDRPAGLIRFGDRIRLTKPVTDAELRLEQ